VYSNGAVDLGDAGAKFRNLYLSGGVVFGDAGGSGTSTTSNTLDSYEEGGWSPILKSGNTTISTSNAVGIYRKVGSMIFLQWSITRSDSYNHRQRIR
jgi:hypothetical protein